MDSAAGQRPPEWYMSWMIGPARSQFENRKEACGELIAALTSTKDTSFDVETLRDLLDILNHEFLCLKLGSPGDCDNFPIVFSREWGDRLLVILSDCLVKSLSPTAYLERELQCRALLTTIALLHAKGVPTLNNGFYDNLYTALSKRFEDLQWQGGTTGELTYAKFCKVQCSYLLSAAKEFSIHFQKEEPLPVIASTKITSLLSFSTSANSSATGGGAFDLHAALRKLNEGLKDVSHRPEKRFQALFSVYEFTILTQALQLYQKIAKLSAYDLELATEAAKRADRFASLTLHNISSILIEQDRCERDKYENRVYPPAEFWNKYVLTTLRRGPPTFNLYYYLYGVVDCAAQIAKVVERSALPPELGVRLRQVALLGDEATHRWKALEYLVSAETNPLHLERALLTDAPKKIRTRFHNELTYITNAVSGDIATYPLPVQHSSTEEKQRKKIISPSSCIEHEIAVTNITPFCHSLPIESPHLNAKAITSAGLAPNCNAAFVVTKDAITVFSLIDIHETEGPVVLATQNRENSDLRQAVISDKYLATITNQELIVSAYVHGENNKGGTLVGKMRLGKASDGSAWVPRFIEIHDSRARTWIAIAGETTVNGASCGIVEIYEVYDGGPSYGLRRHDSAFTLASREVLRGDQIKSISFSPGGGRLACVTNSNRVMVWLLSNNMRPRSQPFVIRHKTTLEPDVRGLTSATIFQSASSKFYVLGTSWPSSERHKNGGEWCFLSPIASTPADVPKKVFHKLQDLGDAGPFIAGAAAPNGDMIALWERSGHIYIVPLMKNDEGGLRSRDVIKLGQPKSSLIRQNETTPSAMRFRLTPRGLELFAIKSNGIVVQKHFEEIQGQDMDYSPRPSELAGLRDDVRSLKLDTQSFQSNSTDRAHLADAPSLKIETASMSNIDRASIKRIDSGVGNVSDDSPKDSAPQENVTRCEVIGKASIRSIVDYFPRGSPCDKLSQITPTGGTSTKQSVGSGSQDSSLTTAQNPLRETFLAHLNSFEELEQQMVDYTSFLSHVRREGSTHTWSTSSPKTPSMDLYMSSLQETYAWVSYLDQTNQSVLDGFRLLQEMQVVEEYVSILVVDNKRPRVARVLPIYLNNIEAMSTAIQESLAVLKPHMDDPREMDWGTMFDALSPLKIMWDRLSAAFELILPGSYSTDDSDLPRADQLEGLQVLNEMILVGLISYTRSHTSPFLQTYVGKACKELGLTTSVWTLKFRQMPIRCLDSLIPEPLWVFKLSKNSAVKQQQDVEGDIFLSTTILDFADLWGPARLALEDDGDETTSEIDWPGGTIRAQLGTYANQPRTVHDEARCYSVPWDKVGTREDLGPVKAFDCTKRLLIS